MEAVPFEPPAGPGAALVCSPPFELWQGVAEANAAAANGWPRSLRELRRLAREETVEEARRFTAGMGLSMAADGGQGLIVMTGHQPILYHPGVWAKDFLVQRFADETGALGIDVVVDTDACSGVALRVPLVDDRVSVLEVPLIPAHPGAAFAQVRMPDDAARRAFRDAGASAVSGLNAPELESRFSTFCDALEAAAAGAVTPGELITAARRRYEQAAATAYLEILASSQTRFGSFRAFAASILTDAARFRQLTNAELHAFRARTKTRSAAQPFPDLAEGVDGRIEAPFWLLESGRRLAVSVDGRGGLYVEEDRIAELGATPDGAAEALADQDISLAPRALALTMFQRMFVADMFVHGTGGGRYDQVTDAVIRGFFGVEPPRYAVATLSMALPLVTHTVTDAEVSEVASRLHRLQHSPETLIHDAVLADDETREAAAELARRKAGAVAAIAVAGADRKALGREIREVNERLAALLEPMRRDLEEESARLSAARDDHAVLTDRTYSFCLFDPREVKERVYPQGDAAVL